MAWMKLCSQRSGLLACSWCWNLRGRALGLTLIFVTAMIWVAASFISEALVSNKADEQHAWHVPPFVLTYLATSLFMLFLPMVYMKRWVQESCYPRRSFRYAALDTSAQGEGVAADDSEAQAPGVLVFEPDVGEDGDAADKALQRRHGTDEEMAQLNQEARTAAAWCFPLWFMAQYAFNVSLSYTSVTSNTILSSTSSLFTFGMSMLFLKEPYSAAKLVSIGACMGGTVLVMLSDRSHDSSSGTAAADGRVLGDLVCILSALCYASYTVVLRRQLPNDDEADVALFFGYVGLFSTLAFAPVVGIMLLRGTWSLTMTSKETYLLILIEGLLNYLLSDYLWARAVLLLGPSVATLGLMVQIPIAAGIEPLIRTPAWLQHGSTIAMTLCGTALILAGFVGGNLAAGGVVPGEHRRGQEAVRSSSPNSGSSDSSKYAMPVSTHPGSVRERSPARSSHSSAGSNDGDGANPSAAQIEMGPVNSSPRGSAHSGASTKPYKASRLQRMTSAYADASDW